MGLRKGQAFTIAFGSYSLSAPDSVNSTAVPAVWLSLDGASPVATTNAAAYLGHGLWWVRLLPFETSCDLLAIACLASGCRPDWHLLQTDDRTGYSLAPTGLDAIQVENGVNARQALAPILASAAGVLLGAGSGTIIVKGGNSSQTRITATTDNFGNRSSVTLTLPS